MTDPTTEIQAGTSVRWPRMICKGNKIELDYLHGTTTGEFYQGTKSGKLFAEVRLKNGHKKKVPVSNLSLIKEIL